MLSFLRPMEMELPVLGIAGPFQVQENGYWTVIGINSYGWGCYRQYADVFAYVPYVLDWINNQISDGTSCQ